MNQPTARPSRSKTTGSPHPAPDTKSPAPGVLPSAGEGAIGMQPAPETCSACEEDPLAAALRYRIVLRCTTGPE